MPRLTGFIGPSAQTQSVVAGSDRTINLIPSKTESGTAAAPYVFDPAPGFDLAVTGITGPCRASFQHNQTCYMVQATRLVRVDVFPFPAITTLATIGGAGQASITAGNVGSDQVLVANGTSTLFWYNTTTTASGSIATVTGHYVAFIDGFFIALDRPSSTMFSSDLNDATTWDPLNFAQRTTYPDQWQTMVVRAKELFVFGKQNTDVYVDDPNADAFPLVPNTNIAINRGIFAVRSLALLQGNPIWLADDKTVRYMQGYNPVRVSTHALEYIFQKFTGLEDVDGYTYQEGGHSFYALNMQGSIYTTAGDVVGYSMTWVYDLSTGLWHERGTPNETYEGSGSFAQLDAIYGVCVGSLAATQGIQIVGSRTDAKVYFMSQEFSTEIDGTTLLTVQRTAPCIVEELQRINHHKFELFAEVGNSSTAGTLTLEYSDDGGQTYTTHSTISAGTASNYNTILDWYLLGQARNRVYRLTGVNITRPRWVDAFINGTQGTS
jgi:hypothetical protein